MGMQDGQNLLVNHEALQGIGADLQAGAKALEDRLHQLERDLNALTFEGKAATDYAQAKLAWNQAMEAAKSLLHDVGRAVHTSNDDYLAADIRGAGRFS